LKRLYPDQPIVGVGAVIVRNSQILLERRKNEPGRGKWSIPGGLVNLGESPTHAVVREVKEETSLKVEKPELIDVVANVSKDKYGKVKYHFIIIDYAVKVNSGSVKASSDALDLKWVPLSEVEKFDLTRTFREFFVRNRQRLEEII
jgi:ADP-ribose pyrophosphatase YjhB (NUDIX family)